MRDRQASRLIRWRLVSWVSVCIATAVAMVLWGTAASGQGLDELTTFLTVDGRNKTVYGYDSQGARTGSFTLNSANSSPSGITGDGLIVHVLDARTKRVYRYSGQGALEKASAELRRADGTSLSVPTGVVIDGDEMWIVDRGRARLFRYSLSDAFSGAKRVSALGEVTLDPGNGRAEGLAMDEVWLYVVDEVDRQIYRYARFGTGLVDASGIMRASGGESLGAPSGVSVERGFAFVVDRGRDKIFEYLLEDLFALFTGSENAVSELRLDVANGDPRGLHNVLENAQPVALGPELAPLTGITDMHNTTRQTLDPKPQLPQGQAFPLLTWDDTAKDGDANLAEIAQTWANGCSCGHNPKAKPMGLGENIGCTFAFPEKAREDEVKQIFNGWSSEAARYKAKGFPDTYPDNLPEDEQYGHYTQIAWKNTSKVGCGAARCTTKLELKDDKGKVVKTVDAPGTFLVCNYLIPGNKEGEQPYPGLPKPKK